MITFRDFALRRGGQLLLAGMDATLHAGWKVGVVGRNGCGKSSLFAVLKGEHEADAGHLGMPTRLKLASVAQETPALPDLLIDYVLGGDVEVAAALAEEVRAQTSDDPHALANAHIRLEALRGYDARARAGRLLHGLGFAVDTHQRAVADFSGGWRVRLNLARALMAPSDLLLLDEPTNHLDLDTVLWLETWLRSYSGTLLVISHDREFLDGICTRILHLHDGRARLYNGNYSAFERLRAEQLRQQQIAFEKEQLERAHLQSFVDRFRAKATKAKQAQSRLKRLEKLAGTEAVRAERNLHFQFSEPQRMPTSLLKLEDGVAGYDDTPILNSLCLHLEAGDRIGLLGPNGAGKSTLVKTLVQELPLLAGSYQIHKDLRIGYFAQHTVESLRDGASPFDHLTERAPRASAQELRNWLGNWGFAGDRIFAPVESFSGGERARLALTLIAWERPNLLLLDEPTNHLDLDMREALVDALNDFPGALVLVSHDRHLLGLACERFWHAANGRITPYEGDLDDYARWLRNRDAEPGTDESESISTANPRQRRRAAAERRQRRRPLLSRLQTIDKQLAELATALQQVETRLADAALYTDQPATAIELGQLQAHQHREHDALETEWLELHEQLAALADWVG